MKKILLSSVLPILLFLSGWAQTQPPDTLWTKYYGETYTNGQCVQQTSDGGYIITGYFGSVYLLKSDSFGNQQWSQIYLAGTANNYSQCVRQTSDSGYIITGYTASFGAGFNDVFLIKTDSLGTQQWFNTYGWGTTNDAGYSVEQTVDGGYIVVGSTGTMDVYLVKTDSLGNQQWFRTFGGWAYECGFWVQQTQDGGYIITGYSQLPPASMMDVCLIKTDSLGNQQWFHEFGGNENDVGYSLDQTSDGGYIIVGYTESFSIGGSDVYLIKTDSLGNQLWYRTFGENYNELGHCIQQTSEGGYIIAGNKGLGLYDSNIYIIKTDIDGNQIWSRAFILHSSSFGYYIQQVADDGYIILGNIILTGCGRVYLIRLEATPFPVIISLTPDTLPIIIPAGGGTYGYTAEIVNSGTTVRYFNGWIDILQPNGIIKQVLNSQTFSLTGGAVLSHHFTQSVPSWASAGIYWNRSFLGANIYNVLSADSFQVTKSADFKGEIFADENWTLSGWDDDIISETIHSSSFNLHPCYPNPFNASTIISFELRYASYVELAVFDVTGRKVTTLITGYLSLGKYQVEWNAEGLPSGIYFARLEVGESNLVRKIILMR